MSEATFNLKLKYLLLFSLAYCFFYLWPNFFPVFTPHFLPLTFIDIAIPFLPWTFTIYLSDYLLACSVIALQKEKEKYLSLVRMSFAALFICGTIFIVFPTCYPRPEYPTNEPWFIQFLMSLIANGDTPNNCFPSMHVTMTGVCAWSIRDKGLKWNIIYWIWSLAIFFTTLTTKQHYLFDVMGGIAVIVLVIFIETKLFSVKKS